MKACGIIVEYNPFHYGHLYHIKQSKQISNCDILIAIMSGNFVQRGEMALCDKWIRAKAAIEHGVDLVVELPFIYASQSGDYFASGAIQIASLLQVSDIVFGSESNDLEKLKTLAKVNTNISKNEAYSANFAKETQTLQSNDILAISYLKALEATKITPHCLLRTNHYHDLALDKPIVSASAIRHGFLNNQDIHEFTPLHNQLNPLHTWSNYYPLLQYLLLMQSNNELANYQLVDEGIEHLFKKMALIHDNYDAFINACISKRYTKASIQRKLVQILCHSKRINLSNLAINYIRPLAFNNQGKAYLKQIKADVMIASKYNQIPQIFRDLELQATLAYSYPLNSQLKKEMIKSEWQSPLLL